MLKHYSNKLEKPSSGVAVILKKKDKFLLVKQNKKPYQYFWAPVHGTMASNETEEEAVIRETYEEVGLNVKPIKKLGVSKSDYKVIQLHWWFAECKQEQIKIDPREIAAFGYFSLSDMLSLKLMPQAKIFFEKFAGKNF